MTAALLERELDSAEEPDAVLAWRARRLAARHRPAAALDHDHDHDEGFSSHDLWDHLNDPANSDLPPDLFAQLAQLGADVVRADATGHGRNQWSHHWATDEGRAQACCTNITVHAAGAYTHPTDPDAVQVTVIWTGTHPGRDNLVEQTSQIHLHPSPNGWRPR